MRRSLETLRLRVEQIEREKDPHPRYRAELYGISVELDEYAEISLPLEAQQLRDELIEKLAKVAGGAVRSTRLHSDAPSRRSP